MPLELTELPTVGPDSWLGAAGFLAVLAFPDRIDSRDRFVSAAKAHVFRRFGRRFMRCQVAPGLTKIRGLRAEAIESVFAKTGHAIVNRRLPAALMANRMGVEAGLSGFLDVERTNGNELAKLGSLTQAADWCAKLLKADRIHGGWTSDKVIERIWRPTLPVLHLAIVLRSLSAEKYGHSLDLMRLIDEPSPWLPDAVSRAEKFRTLLCDATRVTKRSGAATDVPLFRISDAHQISLAPAKHLVRVENLGAPSR